MNTTLTPDIFAASPVLVIGDVMLDRYQWGEVKRISPEAPVPVVKALDNTEVPGGAGNVAANLAGLGCPVCLIALCGDLGTGQQQMVEVAKALTMESKILIMDEPTAALTDREIDSLFEMVETLKKRGIGIIYISHRLEEVKIVGDRVTVLRDGKYIGTKDTKEVEIPELVKMMVEATSKLTEPEKRSVMHDTGKSVFVGPEYSIKNGEN